jgi:glycosyltransferase involved in cell wall biosynthesis
MHTQRREMLGAAPQEVTAIMFCSYIIPTIGRASLTHAVMSVLEQETAQADFEVIVVNDSGQPLPQASWYQSPQVRIIHTNQVERSYARNAGAAVAQGSYLAFLDDDDWILPGAIEAFWQLAKQEPEALWLYGGIRIVNERAEALAELNSGLSGSCVAQVMGGAWAPLQASLIRADAFVLCGGFSPYVCGTEDEDLCRRIAYHGRFANTATTVACLYRGQLWTTSTNYLRAPEDTKYSRNLVLAMPNAFRRLWDSADSSYWYGRIVRVYLSAISWNLQHRRLFAALSRTLYTAAALGLSIRHFASPQYWQGLKAHHAPGALHFVMQDYEQRQAPVHQV